MKDSFYNDLQVALDSADFAGECNAKSGPTDIATRHILGKFALRLGYANGDRLVKICVGQPPCIPAVTSNTHRAAL